MTTSLSNHDPSMWPVESFDEDPYDEDTPDEARLRGLTHEQLADRLTWLAWYQPGGLQRGDGLHGIQRHARRRCREPPVPAQSTAATTRYSLRSARDAALIFGIFIKFGLDYRHYREGAALGQAEIFDPGHAGELAWRLPGSASAGI